ncbi:Thioesterase domain-containing protein [Chitinophaga eiseniae]|uniref:Thioesterase domain-containing protein n=1 Tax=Chitinophaga eiseniae TaxID=634771 RepID=A0A1T4T6A3_9BACT|nr:thioesterase domain-containing protein [Chitinophaga eiseniae]SKA35781.1 Thioesterase domain-containing protein [Chitinophaga eiseniae]
MCNIFSKKNRHIRILNYEQHTRPLFIIPGTGGKCHSFRMLGRMFRNTCSLYGLDMMGAGRGEAPLKDIPGIAAQNIAWIREVQPSGPYRIIGHSFGAYILLEMIKQLEAAGDALDFAIVLDQALEKTFNPPLECSEADFMMFLAQGYFESFKVLAQPYPEWVLEMKAHIDTLPPAEMMPYITACISDRIPAVAGKVEYFSRLVNLRFYNDTMTYVPAGKIYAPVILLRAGKNNWQGMEETLGWSAFSDNITVKTVPGNHYNLMRGKNAIEVVHVIKNSIAACERSSAFPVVPVL